MVMTQMALVPEVDIILMMTLVVEAVAMAALAARQVPEQVVAPLMTIALSHNL